MVKYRGMVVNTGDTLRLGFCSFNNGLTNPAGGVTQVAIYQIDAVERTDSNPLGKSLVTTITEGIINDSDGRYHVDIQLNYPQYVVSRYEDIWTSVFDIGGEPCQSDFEFKISPPIWFTDTMPLVHDFNFNFMPNRVVKGSRKWLELKVEPNLPHGSDKRRYYENVVLGGELYVSLYAKCGDCLPKEEGLRLLVDRELVVEREGCRSWWLLDTTDDQVPCGIYDLRMELDLGENIYISEALPLQIYR